MRVSQLPFLIISTLALLQKASALRSSSTTASNACAALASSYGAQQATKTPTFKPSAVYACLQEVPINNTLAAQQVEWLETYLQFHTTTVYLKNPPPTYQPLAVDLLEGMKEIKTKALAGQYTSEYDFELALYNLIVRGRDGHLVFIPWLVGNFEIRRNVELVSISSDGVQAPKVYFYSDVQANISGNGTIIPSAVSKIDEDDVTNRLIALGYDQRYQDDDAQFNMLFSSPIAIPGLSFPVLGAFTQGLFAHANDTTSYIFENGSRKTIANSAFANLDFGAVTSGQYLFDNFILNTPSTSTNTTASGNSPSGLVTLPGYPQPVAGALSPGSSVSGYFLQDANDTAVLTMQTFSPGSYSAQLGFQKAIREFLRACQEQHKKRLIIDIRQNVGGLTNLVYDAFGQLFPNQKPYSATRLRAFDGANLVGEVLSNLPPAAETQILQKLAQQGGNIGTMPYFGPSYSQTNGTSFPSWAAFYGPTDVYGDNFTHVGAYQLSNSTFTAPLTISGATTNSNSPPQPFTSDNIILLIDGTCQSACAYFANLLMNQASVNTVAIGGRPNTNPMAVIGGTQGGEVLSIGTIQLFIGITQKLAALSNDTRLIAKVNQSLSPFVEPPPIQPVSLNSVTFNVRDNIAKGDESQTPLQFTRTPQAGCRTFYMAGDVLNVTYTWDRVAKGMASGGKSLCINGTSTSNRSSSRNSSSPNGT
ncbi:hypothetical protein EV356DRAFT_533206 [Viridothelium virens]|uniref:Uncharacterized protein n=1 Tax=Viridothelium virens TaxID=1048519 RepID=A0A6A6H885_VIRVR|nr:hypothetical protein EV356DRAFT_533206 [Viridothelium virens]